MQMNCLACRAKTCRSGVSCTLETPVAESVVDQYHQHDVQEIVQTAARLVDGGRAGELSRIEELIEFAEEMGYKRVGLAYCYGIEELAGEVLKLFRRAGVPTTGVSCTVGALSQNTVNTASALPGVSCNPITQAAQMNAEGVDLAVTMGLCLGHDILFNREFEGDVTTLVVKDRVHAHQPVKGIEALSRKSAH
ncbi:MAG: DUF1847 domain-containing protein [Spirochaetota bacterium]